MRSDLIAPLLCFFALCNAALVAAQDAAACQSALASLTQAITECSTQFTESTGLTYSAALSTPPATLSLNATFFNNVCAQDTCCASQTRHALQTVQLQCIAATQLTAAATVNFALASAIARQWCLTDYGIRNSNNNSSSSSTDYCLAQYLTAGASNSPFIASQSLISQSQSQLARLCSPCLARQVALNSHQPFLNTSQGLRASQYAYVCSRHSTSGDGDASGEFCIPPRSAPTIPEISLAFTCTACNVRLAAFDPPANSVVATLLPEVNTARVGPRTVPQSLCTRFTPSSDKTCAQLIAAPDATNFASDAYEPSRKMLVCLQQLKQKSVCSVECKSSITQLSQSMNCCFNDFIQQLIVSSSVAASGTTDNTSPTLAEFRHFLTSQQNCGMQLPRTCPTPNKLLRLVLRLSNLGSTLQWLHTNDAALRVALQADLAIATVRGRNQVVIGNLSLVQQESPIDLLSAGLLVHANISLLYQDELPALMQQLQSLIANNTLSLDSVSQFEAETSTRGKLFASAAISFDSQRSSVESADTQPITVAEDNGSPSPSSASTAASSCYAALVTLSMLSIWSLG